MYSTNPTSGIVEHNGEDKIEYLTSNDNKLIIPINNILPKEVIIFNSDGKLIKQYTTFNADKENIYFDISFLNKGVYFITVIPENGKKANYKFMKGE